MLKITLLILLLSTFTVWAETEQITIAAEDSWPPYANADGIGLANEIITAAFATQNIEVEFHVYPYARVLHYLDTAAYVAGFNVPIDAVTKQKYLLGDTPLYEAFSAYYQNTEQPLEIVNREQFNGQSVGVVRGYGYGQHHLDLIAKNAITIADANTDSANVKRLMMGRLDSALIFIKVANLLQRQQVLPKEVQLAFINEGTDIYLAFSRNHPDAMRLQKKFELGLQEIISTGERDSILAKY
ncbi:substrate-binding periplasmic protein [Pseudoalteromonas prydzensis]|uniref:substrate-binding periplasmic protein n=1 Tax=Pseudoalteromonas prydzensis TaxID=182141 RepID=UPI0024BBFDA7|nr:transporter substrate-binding domain-containing protein [Pseudoalteromonas prydzensis]